MRFVFVDRVLALEPGQAIEVVKNVAATEDVFEDHFPGFPILPGALIVETFDQAAQLLIGATHEWEYLGRLSRLARGSFRQFVRPGDQLRARCERRPADGERWTVAATAAVEGRTVVTATLEFDLEPASASVAGKDRARRLEAWLRLLRQPPIEPAALGGAP
jgi:3-hydroxyacyl-[acyl-carrier-protein] dehydratase